jgi:hypothetical protein
VGREKKRKETQNGNWGHHMRPISDNKIKDTGDILYFLLD